MKTEDQIALDIVKRLPRNAINSLASGGGVPMEYHPAISDAHREAVEDAIGFVFGIEIEHRDGSMANVITAVSTCAVLAVIGWMIGN